MPFERRDTLRVPDSRLITEIVKERPGPASIVNVSNTGIYTVKRTAFSAPRKGLVQMQIPIPEASESIWAVGELMFERTEMRCTGSGIRFVAMADFHKRLLRDLVEYRRRDIYSIMRERIRQHKDLTIVPSPFARRPKRLTEDTVRMYLFPKH